MPTKTMRAPYVCRRSRHRSSPQRGIVPKAAYDLVLEAYAE